MDEDDANANQSMDEETINNQMAHQMEQRREALRERRAASRELSDIERRRICEFCYQPGDHPALIECLGRSMAADLLGVSTVRTAAGQIDDDATAIDFVLPIQSPCLLDEAGSKLRTRRQTLVKAAEHAIPASSDNVVRAVQNGGREDAHQDCRLPGPPELAGDEERGAAPAP